MMLGSFLSVHRYFCYSKVGSTLRSHLELNASLTMPGYAALGRCIKGEGHKDQKQEIFKIIEG